MFYEYIIFNWIILFYNETQNQQLPYIEYFLATLLIIRTITSILFWSNPLQHSTIHKTDAVIAKITILTFILYTLFYTSYKSSYLFLILALAIAFYASNYYSSIQWTSNEHILSHGLLHILGAIGTIYAF
jgi:hypothetical protein